jgi:hypothetical protein
MSIDHAFKQDLARQIIPANGDGGIIAQLSNNPFFTAVLLHKTCHIRTLLIRQYQ